MITRGEVKFVGKCNTMTVLLRLTLSFHLMKLILFTVGLRRVMVFWIFDNVARDGGHGMDIFFIKVFSDVWKLMRKVGEIQGGNNNECNSW